MCHKEQVVDVDVGVGPKFVAHTHPRESAKNRVA